jgi:DNA-binding NtrC family response regulator
MGLEALHASALGEAEQRLSAMPRGVLVCSGELNADRGVEFLARVRERWPSVRRVLLTQVGDDTSPADAVNRAGVHYWIEALLAEAVGLEASPRSACAPVPHRDGRFPQIIGTSPAMTQLLELVGRIARTSSTVLVTGETGTGKELIGQAIHEASPRHKLPFAAVNSAAIPETLLESELFGHRRGAFTGATSDSAGLFEGANGGTVFLDEIGEMPLTMQTKLLRFLQTGEVRPVGSQRESHVDVRLVGATNRCLEDEVSAGNFREDLYYRLAVIPIHVPPLRERLEDIPLLVDHFLGKLAKRHARPQLELDDAARDVLMAHDWPGNVRELENVIERGVALAKGDVIGEAELPLLARRKTRLVESSRPQSLSSIERRHIIDTLDQVDWNRKRAAEILQISTTTLWRRLKEFGLDASTPRPTLSK